MLTRMPKQNKRKTREKRTWIRYINIMPAFSSAMIKFQGTFQRTSSKNCNNGLSQAKLDHGNN